MLLLQAHVHVDKIRSVTGLEQQQLLTTAPSSSSSSLESSASAAAPGMEKAEEFGETRTSSRTSGKRQDAPDLVLFCTDALDL